MPSSDSATPTPPRNLRTATFYTAALVLTAAALIVTSYVTLRTPASKNNLDTSQLQVDTLVRARALYSVATSPDYRPGPDTEQRKAALLRDMARLADAAPTPRSIRRLAIVQYTFGDRTWPASLLRLRTLPRSGATFDTEDELAFWSRLFESAIAPDQVESITERLSRFNLGWYEHMARETAFRRSGRQAEARREVEAANSSTTRLFLLVNLAVLAGMCGIVFGIRQVVLTLRRRRYVTRSAYEFVSAEREPSYTRPDGPQADILYSAFVVYLATFALIRLALSQLTGRTLSALLAGARPEIGLLAQIGVSVLSFAPAIAWLVVRGRPIGLTAQSLGLTSRGLPRDIVWGFTGYAVALPLVYLSSLLSQWLFRGVQSPPHPAIAELVVSREPLYLALMFIQVAVIPPVTEEIMFRGIFFRALTARMTIPAAVVLTSALFAVLHPQLPLGFLGIFILGVVFNLLALYRRSLAPGIIAHALNNGVIFAFFLLLMSD